MAFAELARRSRYRFLFDRGCSVGRQLGIANRAAHELRILVGQDMFVPGHKTNSPPAQRRRKPNRRTVRLELSLAPNDALALRAVARSLNLSVSAYVASLSAAGDAPSVRREQERLADVSRLAAATSQVPDEVRRLRGDLLRLGGLVKSLFIRDPETTKLADWHALECADALRELTRAADRTEPVIGRVEDSLQLIRYELEQTALRLLDER
jgi:hypothetical protein